MSSHPDPRPRRRRLWWLLCVPAVVLLLGGIAYAAYVVITPSPAPKTPAAKEQGTQLVSPPISEPSPSTTVSSTTTSSAIAASKGTGSNDGNPGQGNNGNGNSGSGNGAGNGGNSSSAPGQSLTATFQGATKVAPGVTGIVTIKVTNPNAQDVVLTSVSSTIGSITSGTNKKLPSCDKSWFSIGALSGTPRVAARSTVNVTLPVTMTNFAQVNQDNCKGVTYQFSFTVNGRQA